MAISKSAEPRKISAMARRIKHHEGLAFTPNERPSSETGAHRRRQSPQKLPKPLFFEDEKKLRSPRPTDRAYRPDADRIPAQQSAKLMLQHRSPLCKRPHPHNPKSYLPERILGLIRGNISSASAHPAEMGRSRVRRSAS
jgi:hypothetical protein